MADLTALIERLENADGPDRELDALIWCVGMTGVSSIYPHASNVTASIDAAVALATRLLPGWRIKLQFGENYSIAQFVRGWGARTDTLGVATSERPDNEICLALVTAVLRALSAQEGSK